MRPKQALRRNDVLQRSATVLLQRENATEYI